jgi:twitching motility protein PilT
MHSRIEELLKLAAANKASDIHFTVDNPPKFRVNGELVAIGNFELPAEAEMTEMVLSVLSKEQKERLIEERELDFSVSIDKVRFRGNAYWEKGKAAMVLRVIPEDVPEMTSLNLPPILNSLVKIKQGFILITGPTGQGKSTTVAVMINEINKNVASHIVTIEDPIEYVIKPIKSLVSQRELGSDTKSFEKALRSVLRQDPNVVFVGEMRDLETIQLALTVAETGHLVFSTLHTNSAAQTIDRIIDVFPEGSKEQVRTQLASVITAVISQRLVPAKNGGRIPAMEILVASSAVKNIIREGKTFMIDNIIQTGSDVGMISLEASLAKMVRDGLVDEEVAVSFALRPSELQNNLRSKIRNG